MKLLQGLNAVLALAIEIIALISFSYFGASFFSQRWLQILGAIVSVGVIIIIWGAFFAPKATYRLPIAWTLIGKYLILMLPSYMWFQKGNTVYAGSWFVLIHFHLFFFYIFRDNSIVYVFRLSKKLSLFL